MMTRERIGTEVGLVTGRIKRAYRNGKEGVSNLQSSVSQKSRRAVRQTDYYVHDNAWKMMAISAGLAFAAGFLLSKRNQEGIMAAVDPDNPDEREKAQRLNSWEFIHSALPLALFAWKAIQASKCARKGAI